MPAQKRLYEAEEDDPLQSIRNNYHYEQGEDGDDSDRNHSPGSVDKDEFVIVKLAEVRKEVQCPICLGIIRKTRTVMECLHRFCRECIDKSMRLGNNECPACRTHCASRRSLRDDPNYDALIAALYPDIDRYETDELTFHEEEKVRNKQIQASIAETIRRQSEALGRKRTTAKVSGAAFMKRPEGSYSSVRTRGRRNYRAAELHGSDDDEDTVAHDDVKDSSSEEGIEVKPKRCKRLESAWVSQPSVRASTPNECRDENEAEANRDFMGASAGLVGTAEVLAWGKGGMRSHTRHGAASGGNSKNARNTRLSKLVDYFKNLEDKNYEMDVHLMLISFDDQVPTLERPYLCCRPTLSVRHLRQYVAHQTALQADEIEILAAGEHYPELNLNPSTHVPISVASIVDKSKDAFRILGEQETLAGLEAFNLSRGHLLLAYRKK